MIRRTVISAPMLTTILATIVIAFGFQRAEARKIDLKNEIFAVYFKGTYGLSKVEGEPYRFSSGANNTVDKDITTNASGEFGIALASEKFILRLSGEILLPRHYADIKGVDASGAEQFTLDSKIVSVMPMANLELVARQTADSRFLVGGGYGLAYVTLDNIYTMTDAGTTASGLASFTETAKGTASVGQVFLGYEQHFTDLSTMVFDLGYRFSKVHSIAATRTAATYTGAVEGSDLLNNNGGKRTIDLGGWYVGLSFRFYL